MDFPGVAVAPSGLAAIRWTGYPDAAYYAAKAGVNPLAVSLAMQYAGQHAVSDEMFRVRDAACPTGRMGTGWDVAHAAVFLALYQASYITGVCLPIDGGLSLRGG